VLISAHAGDLLKDCQLSLSEVQKPRCGHVALAAIQ
jgi:hypothetical protein